MSETNPENVYKGLIDAYLEIIRKCVTGTMYEDRFSLIPEKRLPSELVNWLRMNNLHLVGRGEKKIIDEGRDWPLDAETMIGNKRLDNIRRCIEDVLHRGVPGDLIETGVWRGGAAIFMRAVLKAHGVVERNVWAADSFRGLPQPDAEKYPHDAGSNFWKDRELAAPLDVVKKNFERYGLLDGQVKFLEGWFRDTLHCAPIERLSVMRLDGDMYESTMDALDALYPKLSPGGYVIIDDYNDIPECRAAVEDYLEKHEIEADILEVDWTAVYWRKEA